jgi:hypothetical protein
MNQTTFTRKELYDLVWANPINVLSKRYNISYTSLLNACKKLSIPIPDTGHWQKVQFGKPLNIKPLPLEYNGEDTYNFIQSSSIENGNVLTSPVLIRKIEIERDPNVSLTVHSTLTKPDRLIMERQEALKKWKASRNSRDGIYASYPQNILSIDVSESNYTRALCFMDAFIKLLKARGHDIVCNNGTFILVYNQKMQISLVEKMKREMVQHEKYDWKNAKYSRSGILLIRFREGAYHTTDWAEGKQPIGKLLSKIMANIEIKAQELNEKQIRLEKSRAEQREKQLIREQHEIRVKKELDAFKKLIVDANRWSEIKKIRCYIDDIESELKKQKTPNEELMNWVSWARKKVSWYEPNSNVEDDILRGVDKNTLTINKFYY